MDLFVLPSCRKKGVATTLINAAKEWATKRHLDYLELFVLAENENAAHLYMSRGFHVVSNTMRYTL